MNWTTDYPTQPGYYWLRNYMIACDPQCRRQHVAETDSDVVHIDSDLECFWPGNEVGRRKPDIVSAEWYGPIQPPE